MDPNTPAATTGEPKPISRMNLEDLRSLATSLNIVVVDSYTKSDLKDRIVPLDLKLVEFQEVMTKVDAVMPLALTQEQYDWLVSLDGDVSSYFKGIDDVWRPTPPPELAPSTADEQKQEDPGPEPAAASDPPPSDVPPVDTDPPVPPAEQPPITIVINDDLPAPLDMPIAEFIELISSGVEPVPAAVTPEQRDWLKANTFFDDTLWNPDADGIWRKEVVDLEATDSFSLEDIEFELDPAQVKSAVKGWHVTDPIDGTVFAHSEDGWREAEVNSDGSASVTFLANVPRHERSPGYRDSYDRTLTVTSIDHLILALVGLRMAAVESLELE